MRNGPSLPVRTLALVAGALVLATASPGRAADGAPAAADEESASYATPYLYQDTGRGQPRSVIVQYEVGYGSRESRSFTQEGVEQGARLRFQPWARFGVEAFGGVVVDASGGGYRSLAASIEGLGRVLVQARHHVNLDVGAGYIYDYRGDHVPRLRVTLGRSFDRLDVSLSALLEIPVGRAGRDEVDVVIAAAASYRLVSWLRLGLEVAAEDLEGLTARAEAEGGTKLLFGPTLALTFPHGLFLKVNTAAVYAYLANQTFAAGAPRPDEWGVMVRAALGWSWR
jgi:hypothetical protein